jgi:peroxin-13
MGSRYGMGGAMGSYGSQYGGGGMYGSSYGGGMGMGYGMGGMGGMGGVGAMGGMGAPMGDPNDPNFTPPQGPPPAWMMLLHSLGNIVNFFGRISYLVAASTESLNFFMTALLQVSCNAKHFGRSWVFRRL